MTLPRLLQLDWCARGADDCPWFPGGAPPVEAPTVIAPAPIEYAGPVALAMLGAWGALLRARGLPARIDDSAQSVYAWRSGLLSAVAGRFGQDAISNERQVRLRVSAEHEIEETLRRVRSVLHLDVLDEETGQAVAYFLSELLRNVFEHSRSELGAFVSAGWFPRTDRVTFAVVDLGVTIPTHVQRREREKIPGEKALALALEPGVSAGDPRRNAGMGLYMSHRIVTLMGGAFWILTDEHIARTEPSAAPGEKAAFGFSRTSNPWRGTCVAFTVRPNRLASFRRQLEVAQQELAGGLRRSGLDLFRRRVPGGTVTVEVRPDVSTFAQDKRVADQLRDDRILPALARGDVVALDFAGVALTTQSFAHALVAEPLRALGREDVEGRLWFCRASSQVKQVLRIVLGYVYED